MKKQKVDVLGIDIGNVIIQGGNEMFSPRFLEAEEMPGAFESICVLVEHFKPENMFLVSKCKSSRMKEKTFQWLAHHQFFSLTGVKWENVRFCLERHEKARICERLGINIFIDDRLEVLGHLLTTPPQPKTLYLFKPRDEEILRHKLILPNVNRVDSWNELIAHFFKRRVKSG